MHFEMKKLIVGSLLVAASVTSVEANASIVGLANTGAGVTTNGAIETNYSLNGSSSGYVQVGNTGYIGGAWLADSDTSHWITPGASNTDSFDSYTNGTYTWSLSFDLTGYDASTASFTGRFAADNSVTAYLNGHAIGSSSSFSDWTSFGTSNYFVSGSNTLNFVVTNYAQYYSNPTGLRVEFLNSSVAAVPEPSEWAMMLLGLSGLCVLAYSKKKQQSEYFAVSVA